jgi:hypothetical protein
VRVLAIAGAALAVTATALAVTTSPFKTTLTAGTHHPAINTRWPYAVKVVDANGKPVAARITVAVVDPIGGVHPTLYYVSTTKYVTNIPFKGTFRDAVKWPPEAKGYPLTFRVTVKVGTAKKVLKYVVTPV